MAKRKSRSNEKPKKYQIEMTSFSIFLWGFSLFFLLTWIFVLGILVGRGFLPGAVTAISDLKGQISKLQEMIRRDKAEDLAFQKKSDSDTKLAFYEKLSRKKDESKREWPPESGIEGSERETTQKQFNVSQGAPPQERVEAPEKRTSPIKTKTSKGVQPEGKKGLDETQYTVQLASLGDINKAEKRRQRYDNYNTGGFWISYLCYSCLRV